MCALAVVKDENGASREGPVKQLALFFSRHVDGADVTLHTDRKIFIPFLQRGGRQRL